MEMVNVNATWEMPRRGVVKINVHGFFSENRLENGNRSGIGVVVRNNRGTILRMLGGSLCIDERGNNELYAFLEGLKRAYIEDYPEVLNIRRRDKNFALDVRLADPEDNELADYLDEYGASHWKQMVVIKKPFGRVYELWSKDMGLGPVGPQFRAVHEKELNVEVMDDEVIKPSANMYVMVVQNDEEGMMNEGEAEGVDIMVHDQAA
ncbi:hypothetical protein POM88_011862 [Heracleum sosnowskyi]|uniref:RNase H type-1 domain-containing protein n=1 Tax=Heracleum sosnowskyi TaxID=360622 RepID=A0AAD8N1P5_9APIA|nr:hypothetical protein POM88_011862 [Heracleum sosnowskyi]